MLPPKKASSTPLFSFTTVDIRLSHLQHLAMSSIIGRSAFRATRPLRATATRPLRTTGATIKDTAAAQTEDREAGKKSLQRGARKDPELYVRPNMVEKEEG